MHWLAWAVLILACIEGGWLAFDGGHALVFGDYVTPGSGQYAGQLGPWATIVSAVGIEPRSTLMKSIHLALGLVWLVVIICFALRVPGAWSGMLVCAVLGLWYLPFGTIAKRRPDSPPARAWVVREVEDRQLNLLAFGTLP